VGKFILNECLCGYLKEKTRILITHKLESLKFADYIYILKDGCIGTEGNYNKIRESALYKEIESRSLISSEPKSSSDLHNEKRQLQPTEASSNTAKSNQKANENIQNQPLEEEQAKNSAMKQKEDDKLLFEKLMIAEDREVGKVGWNVWKSFFNYYGGTRYFIMLFIVMVIWVTLYCACNFWLSYWSNRSAGGDNIFYFEVYALFVLGYGALCYIRGRQLFLQAINCSRTIHREMLQKIFRAPVNLFFDRIPIGRLLNRFSKDLSVIDTSLITCFNSFLLCIFILFADFLICGTTGSIIVYPLAAIFFKISFGYQEKYMKVQREAYRLGKKLLLVLQV